MTWYGCPEKTNFSHLLQDLWVIVFVAVRILHIWWLADISMHVYGKHVPMTLVSSRSLQYAWAVS